MVCIGIDSTRFMELKLTRWQDNGACSGIEFRHIIGLDKGLREGLKKVTKVHGESHPNPNSFCFSSVIGSGPDYGG